MSSIIPENVESREAVCSRKITELAYKYRNSHAGVAENHYRTIRLLEACTGPFYGIDPFRLLREEIMSGCQHPAQSKPGTPEMCGYRRIFSRKVLADKCLDRYGWFFAGKPLEKQQPLSHNLSIQVSCCPTGNERWRTEGVKHWWIPSPCWPELWCRWEGQNWKGDGEGWLCPLKNMTVIDTPGLNSKLGKAWGHNSWAYVNSKVQVALWVFCHKACFRSELGYLDVIKSHGCSVYGIINMIDAVNGFHKRPESLAERDGYGA